MVDKDCVGPEPRHKSRQWQRFRRRRPCRVADAWGQTGDVSRQRVPGFQRIICSYLSPRAAAQAQPPRLQ
eukprot:11199008-Lingulodinium_polyedra.AAC.1